MLIICSVIGWGLGAAVAAGFLLLLLAGRQAMVAEQHRSLVSATEFIAKVRACRRQSPGPTPSWSVCEQRVRAHL